MLPTTLRIAGENRLMREPGVTMNPFGPSRSEQIGNGLGSTILQILNTMEQGKQQNRQKSIIENILAGKPEEEWVPKAQQPTQADSILGRVLQGMGGMFDINQAPMQTTPLETAIAQNKIKRAGQSPISGLFSTNEQGEYKLPEGMEIVGYDQRGQPMIRKKALTSGEKANEKAKLEANRNFQIARNKLKVTSAAFKAMVDQEGAGRIGGTKRVFTGAIGTNPYVKPFEGQLVESAAALAKLAAPSARVGQEIIAQFKKTLPTKFSTWDEYVSQIRFSLHNAFGTALGSAGEAYTKDTSDMVDEMVSDLVNVEPLSIDNIRGVNSQSSQPAAIPQIGQTFQGQKVTKIRRVR